MCSEHFQKEKKNHSRVSESCADSGAVGAGPGSTIDLELRGLLTPRLRTVNGGPACADRGILLWPRSLSTAPNPPWCSTLRHHEPAHQAPVLRSPPPDRQPLHVLEARQGRGRPSWTGLEGDPADRQGGVRTLAPAPAQGSLWKRAVWRARQGLSGEGKAEPCWSGCCEVKEKTHTRCPRSKESSARGQHPGASSQVGQKPHEKQGHWPLPSQWGQNSRRQL